MRARHPLSRHAPDDVIAHCRSEAVTAGRFFRDAMDVASAMTGGGPVINTCHDRYLFAVGLGAALLTGRVTLMPSSFAPRTTAQLQARYEGLVCLHDGRGHAEGMPGLRLQDWLRPGAPPAASAPLIDAAQIAATVFTSGSTGEPTAHDKTWGRLCANGAAEAQRLGAAGKTLVATVPAQHMYGFESSVLMALHGGAVLWHGRPFYPADIAQALAAVPRPRMLVSTPFHLTTLLDAEVALPACDLVLSATAPLAPELVSRTEAAFAAPLMEIYGCTESGQIASRRPTAGPEWQLLPGVCMDADAQGAWVYGGHVEKRVLLSDRIEAVGADRFLLLGRHADMVNIAGKRTSLAYLNTQLTDIPGVVDGCFIQPDETSALAGGTLQRLAALVVAPGLDERHLMVRLRERIDAVFLPRPLLFVDAIPRNHTGKMVRADLLALYRARQSGTGADAP